MNTLLLTIAIFGISIQGIAIKTFEEKTGGKGLYLFSMISRLAGILFFVATAGKLSFCLEVLPYSIAFGIFYGICVIFNILSIKNGSLPLTSLISSYSLMLPTAYGLIFLHDPISIGFVPGLIFLLVSLFLINSKNGTGGTDISAKWVMFVSLVFIGNGGSSIVQSMQQRAFQGNFKSEFMIMALLIFVIVTGVLSWCNEKKDIIPCTKKGWMPAVVCGVANALVNLLIMVLQEKMSVSVLFPMVSAGGLVLTYFLSRFLYKEKLSSSQLVGFALGTLSVVFLNI